MSRQNKHKSSDSLKLHSKKHSFEMDIKFNDKKLHHDSNISNFPNLYQSASSGSLVNGYGFYRLNFIKPLSRDIEKRAAYSNQSESSKNNSKRPSFQKAKGKKSSFLGVNNNAAHIPKSGKLLQNIRDIAGMEVDTKAKFGNRGPSRDTSPYHPHQSTNVNTMSNFQNNHMKETNTTLNNNYFTHSKNNSRLMNETQNYQTSYDLFKTNAMHIKPPTHYMNNTVVKDAFGRDETAAQTGNFKSFVDDNGKVDSAYENESMIKKDSIDFMHDDQAQYASINSQIKFDEGGNQKSSTNLDKQNAENEEFTKFDENYNDSYLRNQSMPSIRPKNFDVKVAQHDRNFRILANENIRVNSIKDNRLRNLMIRDQLLIFMDKLNNLKKKMSFKENEERDLKKQFKLVDQVRVNKQLELIIALCDNQCKRLIRELYDKLDQQGLSQSPFVSADTCQVHVEEEIDTFERNYELFCKMVEYTGNCVTIFFYICKNDLLEQLSLKETHYIIKVIEKLRFFVGILCEDLRLKEKDYAYSSNKHRSSHTTLNDQSHKISDFTDESSQLEIHNRVKTLYARKLHKKQLDNTRESKVQLSNFKIATLSNNQAKKVSDLWKSNDQKLISKVQNKQDFVENQRKNQELQNSQTALENDNFENPENAFMKLDFISQIIKENFSR